MNDTSNVFQVGGLTIIIYTIFASAYYAEAGRWLDRASRAQGDNERTAARQNSEKAEIVFRICSALMVLGVVCTILPSYVQLVWVAAICKWALLLPLAVLLFLSMRFVFGKLFVPLSFEDESD